MVDVVTPPGHSLGQAQWKPDELELRREEIRYNRTTARTDTASTVLQSIIAVAAVIAAGVAFFAARKAGEAVNVARDGVAVAADGIERQSAEDRLATAISATGGSQAAEREAGFRLLEHLSSGEIAHAGNPTERADARVLYDTSLDVLEVYLRNGPDVPAESEAAGLGYGDPEIPLDNFYAAGAVRRMMDMEDAVLGLAPGSEPPSVDLSFVQLHGVSWPGIDFSWLSGQYFTGIDLRGANLRKSHWDGAALNKAHLQCALFTDAEMRGVDLSGADLRGATLINVDFTGAVLEGADLRAADLTGATGLTREQVAGALRDINTGGLDTTVYGAAQGPLATAPPTTDGTCLGDYQALPEG